MKGLILYSGALAQVPRQAGLTWFHLQFLLGFRRLGWEVLFLDWIDSAQCVDEAGLPTSLCESLNVRYLLKVLKDYGLSEHFALRNAAGEYVLGLSRECVLEKARSADFLLNVMGYWQDEELLALVKRKVFLDIDPGFGQMWRELGWHDSFRGHDQFVSMGRNIGRVDCTIPTCGLEWQTMPHPIVLEHWPVHPPCPTGAYTSIGAWRGPNGPIEFHGKHYGLRVHEFRKFVSMPERCRPERFEMAMEIHPGDHKDIQLLTERGWHLVDPQIVASGPLEYQAYLNHSKAEFMIPKQMYVETKSGLLSDRSVYYLATGRPVVGRDTGIADWYPTGDGLLTFSNTDEAVAAVEKVEAEYPRHCRAARDIAEAYFNSDLVLTQLLHDLSATPVLKVGMV